MQIWEFDVFTADHDSIKGGGYTEVWSRVCVSATEYPTYAGAYDVAACLAVAVHGGMPTRVMVRY